MIEWLALNLSRCSVVLSTLQCIMCDILVLLLVRDCFQTLIS